MTERPTLVQLSDEDRAVALQRFALLRPALEDGIPLAHLARSSGIPLRTAQRWVAQYRQLGLAGIARTHRRDRGTHRFPTELLQLVEGLALRRPPPWAATVHRRISAIARDRNWPVPSYSTVYAHIPSARSRLGDAGP